jgi:hypothetical protein
VELINMYRIFHTITTKYTFFSPAHRTSSKIHHILGHKASLNKYTKIEITFCISSGYNRLKLVINSKETTEIFKHRETEQYTVDQWVTKEIREEIK